MARNLIQLKTKDTGIKYGTNKCSIYREIKLYTYGLQSANTNA